MLLSMSCERNLCLNPLVCFHTHIKQMNHQTRKGPQVEQYLKFRQGKNRRTLLNPGDMTRAWTPISRSWKISHVTRPKNLSGEVHDLAQVIQRPRLSPVCAAQS
ncbi:hypothetical protein M404DRAFT_512119 [Pisolithus tinctorius Marx 270]|uniref:Uncharacterized protein n=1 Tax=Pisolithus tinctorius Marx 270 TaxID=870435 RepID=A0A0C3PC43_PISTI|nr:hypothetical protein M404DRAFT_774333 [Pisolithus tinctorius Marx 270]KIO05576.1 hypothetical protein M404DRAFT_512119 [Pisolithus tinctorius Marx 270]